MNKATKNLKDLSIAALSEHGNLAAKIPDFKVRSSQQEMAAAVAEAILTRQDLVAEAATGIGKTFAYLVPALLSNKRTIISTATRHLQDQIYFKDLPTVINALGIVCETALLKGRANYLCVERMKRASQQNVLDKNTADQIHRIEQWSYQTTDGDINSITGIPEDDILWLSLTSTVDNCLRKECEYYDSCYVFDARQKAAEADLVVVNHALLMADMTLKEEGFAKFLPDAELIVVDEAHRLKDFAEQNFTENFSSRAFSEVLNEIDSLLKDEAKPNEQLQKQLYACRNSMRLFTTLFRSLDERAAFKVLQAHRSFDEYYGRFNDSANQLVVMLKPYKTLSEQWENCIQRMQAMLKFIASLCVDSDDSASDESTGIAWFHRHQSSFQIYLSPMDVSTLLIEKSKQYDASWVYTSATLAVKDDFSYFLSNAADEDKVCCSYESPFDYPSQAALYTPTALPHPQDPKYTRCLMKEIRPILSLAKGHTFLLFTSYRALHEAEALLAHETGYTLLVQTTAPKSELIKRFIAEDNTVLLGTNSFWHGVDIKGDALRCVVIDRLPFAAPSDPLLQARKAFFEKQQRDFFTEYSLPEAVITLRQGVGRLIRSESDSGVIVIGDPRLRQKSYGRIFMRSLPALKRCKDIASLESYLG